MANELRSYPVPNLVQGVSQQVAEQRRETQAESQYDCMNSPVNGCEARPPVEVLGFIREARFSRAFCHEIARGNEEHYLAIATDDVVGAQRRLRVFDLLTGDECEVTFTDPEAYLAVDNDPRDSFRATTLEDYTFLANREVHPRIDPDTLAPNLYNEGIIYFKAGGYKITFQVSVTLGEVTGAHSAYSNKVITFRYETPDNSTVDNAGYITTNQLAATFFRAFTGGTAAPITTNTTVVAGMRNTGGNSGVGAAAAGVTGVTGATTLSTAGFYVALNGNCILIGRTDGAEFSIDTSDGVGDTYLRAIKDHAQSFQDLPKSCFVGFTTAVKGSNREADDDYFVTFAGKDGQAGYWEECPKPGIPINLDASRMPHALANTGYRTFEWLRPPWGARVSGDGENTSVDPSFVDQKIEDLYYAHNRLGILTEGATVESKNRNPFVFFPTSAQTILATDPVDISVGGGDAIALLRRAVQVNEFTFLWATSIQFKLDSGAEPFKQDTVESKRSTKFEFAERSKPQGVGASLYFATEPGEYCTIRDLLFQEGKFIGETDVTAHVPKYIPAGLRIITASDARGVIFYHSDRTPSLLYVYNFLTSERERLQSAWNIWRLPTGCQIVWAGVRKNYLNLLIQRGDWGALLCRIDLTVDLTDPEHSDYLTRTDLRLPEGLLQFINYDPITNRSRLYLPFPVDEVVGRTSGFYVATRTTSATSTRGKKWDIEAIARDATWGLDYVEVIGDARGEELYLGFQITAERTESEFFIRTPQGVLDVERIDVKEHRYGLAKTGYTRAEVTERLGATKVSTYEFSGRIWGDPANVMGSYVLTNTALKVPINKKSDEYTCRLINDSFLPSRWTSLKVRYTSATFASPVGGRGGAAGR